MKNMYGVVLFLCLLGPACKSGGGSKEKKIGVGGENSARVLSAKPVWTIDDYDTGVELLSSIQQKDSVRFASYLRKEGSGLFSRLTDRQQYDSLLAGKTQDQQFEITVRLVNALSRLIRTCYSPGKENGKLVLGKEMITNTIATLYMNGKAIALVNNKFPDKAALDSVQQQGLRRAQTGVFEMIYGALLTIGNESTFYEQEDILRLVSFLPAYTRETVPFLSQEKQERIASMIKTITETSSIPGIKQAFAAP